MYYTLHWQASGENFYSNHLLFERLYNALPGQFDTLAEKIVAMCGSASVNAVDALNKTSVWVKAWSAITNPIQMALRSESEVQQLIKDVYDKLKAQKQLSCGMDDYLLALANEHETNQYLLGQLACTDVDDNDGE